MKIIQACNSKETIPLTRENNAFHLEKEMATHSSTLAWRIPGTGEPGGLPSMGSHRVGLKRLSSSGSSSSSSSSSTEQEEEPGGKACL